MSSSFLPADIAGLLGTAGSTEVKNSTSRKGNTELNMEDFLSLMIVQLQNQTIDDTMDTSEMMNQMIQMQMITALTNMTDASVMSYASSLVGKEVTIGITDGTSIEERVIEVIGTGTFNGQQVIFGDDGNYYTLSQIMAVGRLPEIEELPEDPGEDGGDGDGGGVGDVTGPGGDADGGGDSGAGGTDGVDGSQGADGSGDAGGAGGTEGSGDAGSTGGTESGEDVSELPGDRDVTNEGETEDVRDDGEEPVVDPTQTVE